ncbi:thiamine pyrophosphate-binding protein [Rhodobacteraceae bacterium D3-12]|nr:thiamine pyrophosphate-binding protein [Rhodobacteraceae bacterium D3-12]
MSDQATSPLGAQISHMLKSRGVDTIFGIPGVHNIEMYRGIEDAGITHILARHEQGAGFMADGFARATGRPGVAYVITGPGVCNIMTPMGQAYSDSVPMLVISSCLDETARRCGQLHQMLDQESAAATVCDWSHEARTPQSAFDLIDRAFCEFNSQRKRPKHIQVPIALGGIACAPAPNARDSLTGAAGVGGLASADPTAITALSARLAAAQKPLFIFGGGVVAAGAEQRARDMLQHFGAAGFTTYAAGGVLAPDDPMSFGCYLGRPESASIIASSDLVIAIGTELAEVDLWRNTLGHTATLVRVDIDPAVLADEHRADIIFRADAKAFLDALLAMSQEASAKGNAAPSAKPSPKRSTTRWDAAEIAAFRARSRAEVDAERPGITPICDALRDCLPVDAMIYSDMTQFAYVAREVWDMPRAGHWHHPTGFGTLGYALPAAIGGAVARSGLPTLAIAGDYGLQYTIQELGTAVELRLPLPILIWDNAKLGEIEDAMTGAQIAPNAVVARNPDFLKLAEAYGAYAAEPTTLADLQKTTLAALSADRPTLIRMTSALSV